MRAKIFLICFLITLVLCKTNTNLIKLKNVEMFYDVIEDKIHFDNKIYSVNKENIIIDQKEHQINSEHEEEDLTSEEVYIFIGIIAGCTLFAGLMSGLTVGYLSIDTLILELKASTGTKQEKHDAEKLLPILAQHHWLLVTLLLANAAAMEALPLFLDRLVPEYLAVIISVTLVLLFGEVIPQAICTGKSQVRIAAVVSPLVKFLMYVLSPISYPIARLLDFLLGKHSKSRFLNTDLKALIELHTHNAIEELYRHRSSDSLSHSHAHQDIGLDEEQARLMIAAIELKDKTAGDIMTKIEEVYMLSMAVPVSNQHLEEIMYRGLNSIPVYSGNRNNIIGILKVKSLLGVDLKKPKLLKQFGVHLKTPMVFSSKTPILEMLKEFKKSFSKMAIITEDVHFYMEKYSKMHHIKLESTKSIPDINIKDEEGNDPKILGIATISDLIEKIISVSFKEFDDTFKMNAIRRTSQNILSNKIFTDLSRNLKSSDNVNVHSLFNNESISKRMYKDFTNSPNLKDPFK